MRMFALSSRRFSTSVGVKSATSARCPPDFDAHPLRPCRDWSTALLRSSPSDRTGRTDPAVPIGPAGRPAHCGAADTHSEWHGGGMPPARATPVNATAAALLGLLHTGPMTGGQLVAAAGEQFGAFFSVTRSQIYRELPALAGAGLLKPGKQ